MDTVLEQFGPSTLTVSKLSPIIDELTNIICNWGTIWKQLYVSHDRHFNNIEKFLTKLLKYRALLKHAKNFPVDETNVIQKLAISYINYGNKLLNLDMKVWDEHGNILNPLHTSTFKFYKYLEIAFEHTPTFNASKKLINQSTYQFYRYEYIPIHHKNKQSLIRNVNYLKFITDQKIISLYIIKSDLRSMITNGDFKKGNDVLNLLYWKSCPDKLLIGLSTLNKLCVNELFMFLRDILDALFNIYKYDLDPDVFDNIIFDCLLYITELVSDKKYQHFCQFLDLYIDKYFDFKSVHVKLMAVLKSYLDSSDPVNEDNLSKTVKSFNYIIKFIIKSKLLSSESMQTDQIFEKSMNEIFELFSNLMCRINTSMNNEYLLCACLECVLLPIPDIITVFSSKRLSLLLVKLINNLPSTKLIEQKLNIMSDIVHSKLFLNADCQDNLLPFILDEIIVLLKSTDDTTCISMCVHLLGDIMDLLHAMADSKFKSTFDNITKVMLTSLNIIVQVVIKVMHYNNVLVRCAVSLMLSILHQMTDQHFKIFIAHFTTKADLSVFLKNILILYKDLMSNSVFPTFWNEMIMIQNCVILKSLRYFSLAIYEYFLEDIDHELWENFFHCTYTFIIQPSLQLEKFSSNKQSYILSMYEDMRIEAKTLIWTMWSHLGKHKIYFIPDMIGPFLEISLIPNYRLRKTVIPIFFDMMECEFYSCANDNTNTEDMSNIKGEFNVFQNKMILNLNHLIVHGRGDLQFKELFKTVLSEYCENHSIMRDQGLQFIEIFAYLIECLLDYQMSMNDENKENRIHCIVKLLYFYKDMQHLELMVSYIKELCPLHLKHNRFIEAAFTLKVHSELLSWSNDTLPSFLRNPSRYPSSETHYQLKEALYIDIIDYFNQGEMWECAVTMCKELVNQYESEAFNCMDIRDLLQQMSTFYDKILKQSRSVPVYFKIAYYGKGFPSYLQNKVFIYRDNKYANIHIFSKWIKDQFPDATLMNTLSQPESQITESSCQLIQINCVEPIIAEHNEQFSNELICENILQYYKVNQVKKFKYSRISTRVDPFLNLSKTNEFISKWTECIVVETAYTLPSLIQWSPVINSHTYEISPLNNAIEDVKKKNKSLRRAIRVHENENLSRNLHSTLNAFVNGGIFVYKQAFFTPEYLSTHNEEKTSIEHLKKLIVSHISLLDLGLKLFKSQNQGSQDLLCMILSLENKFLEIKTVLK